LSSMAVIAGTGARRIFQDLEPSGEAESPYGRIQIYTSDDLDPHVPIVLRHGFEHRTPPHLVNYRAIVAGLWGMGVERILALGAVGSLRSSLRPGDMVIPDQVLDLTRQRVQTFVEELGASGQHIDVTDPFCPELRKVALTSAAQLEIALHPRAVYVCVEGPRYETAAEIRMFKMLGGDLVGMTCAPEVFLAREKGMCYMHISLVTNMAAGIQPTRIIHRDLERVVADVAVNARRLLRRVIENESSTGRNCSCGQAAEH